MQNLSTEKQKISDLHFSIENYIAYFIFYCPLTLKALQSPIYYYCFFLGRGRVLSPKA